MSSHADYVFRDELMFRLKLERAFVERWLDSGDNGIPQMPHLPTIGKACRFHIPSVEEWLLRYFQKGGDPGTTSQKRGGSQ